MIYFARDVEGGPIKNGTTEDLSCRLGQLRWKYGQGVVFLGILPGHRSEEALLHREFRSDRIRGEWFRPSPRLIGYIENNAQRWDEEKTRETVRMDRKLVRKVHLIAQARQCSSAEYLDTLSRQIDKDYAAALEALRKLNE